MEVLNSLQMVIAATKLKDESYDLKEQNGYSTMAVTDDGTANGKLLGIVTGRDYRVSRMETTEKVKTFMTPLKKLVTAPEGTTLKEANDIMFSLLSSI